MMKKYFIIAGMIATPLTAAIAKSIDFDTPVEWNSAVVEQALNQAGFLGASDAYYDVRVTHKRILSELLKKNTFSLRDATQVCLDKCNLSDFLKNGRGASGKKCPDLCESFASNIITVNNQQTSIPSANGQSSTFAKLQGKSIDVCRNLMDDAQKSGISYPVLCGGTCHQTGDDVITITDAQQTKEYKVNDFCDWSIKVKDRDYWYIMVSSTGAEDVSNIDQSQRMIKLRTTQTQPVTDYYIDQERKKKEQTLQDYAKRVEKNGYCEETITLSETLGWDYINAKGGAGEICKKSARKYAQSHACKLKTYVNETFHDYYWPTVNCLANSTIDDSKYPSVWSTLLEAVASDSMNAMDPEIMLYEYIPSYSDCVATFNNQDCDAISQGRYKN